MSSSTPGGQTARTQHGYDTSRAVMLAGVAALGGFLFGFDTAVINGTVDAVQEQLELGPTLVGFVVASALLGSMVGAYAAGSLADRYGRIRLMVMSACLFVISSIGSGLAYGPWDLTLWRIVGGLGVGAASVLAPAYIAEISPAAIRGRLGSLQQLAITSGILVALLADLAIASAAGGASAETWLGLSAWRWMFFTEIIPAVIYGVLALQIPESPRYLMTAGRTEEARRVLASVMHDGVDERIDEIRQTAQVEQRSSFANLRSPATLLLPIVWVGILLSAFQQLVGINVIFYYSSTLFTSVGFSASNSLVYSVVTAVTNVVFTLVGISVIDKIGRRKLLMIGSAGMLLSLGVLAVTFGTAPVNAAGEPALSDSNGLVALVAANAFVISFASSWGPAVWVLLGEMFNNRIRATALGLAAAAQWVSNFAITLTFPPLSEVSLGLAYGLYTLFATISFFFVLKFVPETNGRELEDM